MTGTGLDEASGVAGRIREAVAVLDLADLGDGLAVTVSSGLALREPSEEVIQWIARADAALYEAKGRGRDCVGIAPPVGSLPDVETSIDTDRIKAPVGGVTETLRPVRIDGRGASVGTDEDTD